MTHPLASFGRIARVSIAYDDKRQPSGRAIRDFSGPSAVARSRAFYRKMDRDGRNPTVVGAGRDNNA